MAINTLRRRALLKLMPEGVPVTRAFLKEKGLSVHALDNLVKSHDLNVLASGVYARPETSLTWQGIVCSLQNILKLDLTVGGLTALDLQGLSHYLALGSKKTIHLHGSANLPSWVNSLLPEVTFVRHGTAELLGRGKDHASTALQEFTVSYSWRDGASPLSISPPERAFLELLMDVPEKTSFAHADELMQGLTNLNPRRLQSLLEKCQNIKVRRLFLWLAERHKYAWVNRLNHEKLPLGSGKRLLAKGGKLDHKYQITVPEDLWTETATTSSKSSS